MCKQRCRDTSECDGLTWKGNLQGPDGECKLYKDIDESKLVNHPANQQYKTVICVQGK